MRIHGAYTSRHYLRKLTQRPCWAWQIAATVLASLLLSAPPAQAQVDIETADAYYENASQRAAQDDDAGAIIQLKNALRLDNSHTPSLLLLGELILDDRQPSVAALLLSEALLLGADGNAAIPLLVKAYLQSGDFNAVLSELPIEDAPRRLRAELTAAHAQAYLGLGQNNTAAEMIELALAIEPGNLRAQLARSTLLIRQQDAAAAMQLAEQLLAEHPDDNRAWSAYASALQFTGENQAAIDAYERALELEPDNVDARLSLIAIMIQLGRESDAAADVSYIRENFPNEPRGAYFDAVLASVEGDTEREQRSLAEAANGIEALDSTRVSGDLQLLMIGALSNMGIGAHEVANSYLERYLSINPDDPGAERLYAANLLTLGANSKALRTLLRLKTNYPQDVQTRSLLASAYAATGRHLLAAEALAPIVEAGAGSDEYGMQFGLSLLNAGRLSESIRTLEIVAASQPENASLQIPLAVAYMRSSRWSDADTLLRTLLEANPDDSNLRNLLSLSLLSQNRIDEAEVIMQALSVDQPDYLPAQINLARLKTRQGDFSSAGNILTALREARPDDARVVYESARLALAEGNTDEALRLAERAAQLDPRSTAHAELLVRRYLAGGMNQQAEDLAKKVSGNSDDTFAGTLLYARTLVTLGKAEQAAVIYRQMARVVDHSAAQLLQVAQWQSRLGEHEAAIFTLSLALSKNPGLVPARRAIIGEHLATGQFAEAAKLAGAYQAEFPDDPTAYLLAGEAALAQGEAQRARTAFVNAEKKGATSQAVLGQYRALRAKGDIQAAMKLLERNVDLDTSRDLRLIAAYSDVLLGTEQWAEAEAALTRIVTLQPGSWVHWNNRAAARWRLGDAGAEADARKALELAPGSAAANDTLGWILAESGKPLEALPFLREAAARDSTNPAVRYHLAVTLALLGREQEAENELRAALERKQSWSESADAKALLARLREKT